MPSKKRKRYLCKSCKYNESGFCILRHLNKLTNITRCEHKIERSANVSEY